LEILAPRHSRTSKKQGNGEADGSGQVFHTGSLAENGNGANTLVGALWVWGDEMGCGGLTYLFEGKCPAGTLLVSLCDRGYERWVGCPCV